MKHLHNYKPESTPIWTPTWLFTDAELSPPEAILLALIIDWEEHTAEPWYHTTIDTAEYLNVSVHIICKATAQLIEGGWIAKGEKKGQKIRLDLTKKTTDRI